jgi:radical SAM protein with 4Fe4S-binding SPASM domain
METEARAFHQRTFGVTSQGAIHGHLAAIERNLELNHREQYEQREYLRSHPIAVAVPTGGRCNLRCLFCTDRETGTPQYTDLTLSQFLTLADAIGDASRVQLYGWGEPFLNPAYETIFDHVADHYPGIRIHISTNGTLLSQHWIDKLIGFGKCLVNVSLNAATPETYARVTGRTLFHDAVGALRRLVRAREERDADDFVVTASFVTIKQNRQDLPRFIELCAELGIRNAKLVDLNILSEKHRGLFLGDDPAATRAAFLHAREIALKRGVCIDTLVHSPAEYYQQDRSSYSYPELPKDLQPFWKRNGKALFYPQDGECYEPWQTFMMTQGGAVYTCCRGREAMGNLREQSFEEVWNGEKYRAYRRSINSFRPPFACRECPVKMGYARR